MCNSNLNCIVLSVNCAQHELKHFSFLSSPRSLLTYMCFDETPEKSSEVLEASGFVAFIRSVCFISPTALKHQHISLIRPRMGCLH